jgi:RNA polymerase sigma factor (TIGR02999 family)
MPDDPSGDVTRLLQEWTRGDERAFAELVPLVHRELRRLARQHLQAERRDHTLQSSALVNEAFLRLVGSQPSDVHNRSHFIAIASHVMRQILVDYARKRRAAKRDGGEMIILDGSVDIPIPLDANLVAIDEALEGLARIDERQAKIVELKFFGGLSAAAISELLGLSRATVDRDWATARAWLYRQLRGAASP